MDNFKIKKQQCIEEAINAKILSANNRLEHIVNNGISYENPINLLFDGVKWKERFIDKLLQIFIFFLSIPFILILSPISWLINFIDIQNEKNKIRQEIKSLKLQKIKDIDCEYKSLENFWNRYGLDINKYSEQEIIDLMEIWIIVLFGKEVAKNIDINSQLNKIKEDNIKANKPYYDGIVESAHYYFEAPVITLINTISKKIDNIKRFNV